MLLKNEKGVLPLDAAKIRRVAVIGGHADVGMISGGGSAQVDPPGGNAIAPPGQGATHWQDHVSLPHIAARALREKLPYTTVEFDSGQDPTSAVTWPKAQMSQSSLLTNGSQKALI